jgi:hypothetical protein
MPPQNRPDDHKADRGGRAHESSDLEPVPRSGFARNVNRNRHEGHQLGTMTSLPPTKRTNENAITAK